MKLRPFDYRQVVVVKRYIRTMDLLDRPRRICDQLEKENVNKPKPRLRRLRARYAINDQGVKHETRSRMT